MQCHAIKTGKKLKVKKVKAVDLYSASSCTPKAGGEAGGQATSNVLSSLTGAAGHTGHCPQIKYLQYV